MLCGVAALWGSTLVLTKDLMERMPAPDLLAWRFGIAAVALALLAPGALRMSAQTWRHGIMLGLLLALAQSLQTIGLPTTGAALSGFLTGLYLVATPLIGWAVTRVRPSTTVWLAVGLATVGLAVLSVLPGASAAPSWGVVLTVVGAVGFGAHIVAVSRVVRPHNAISLTLVQTAVMGLVGLVWALPSGLQLPQRPGDWVLIGYLAVLCGAVALVVQMGAQCHVEPTKAAVIMVSEPLWGAGLTVVLSDETLTWTMVFGGLTIVAAGLIVVAPWGTRPRAARLRSVDDEGVLLASVVEGGAGHLGEPRIDQVPALFVEHPLMDQQALARLDRPSEIDGLFHGCPGSIGGDSDHVNTQRCRRQRIPGVKEPRLAGSGDHQANIAQPGNVAVDHRVEAANHRQAQTTHVMLGLGHQRIRADAEIERSHRTRLHHQLGLRVGSQ